MLVKSFLSFAALIMTLNVTAQEFEIKNLTAGDENSKTIYLGIDNKFKVPNLTAIANATSKRMEVKFNEDTVQIVPYFIGTEKLSFQTKNDTQLVSFTTEKMPDMFLLIAGMIKNNIEKNEFLRAPQISIATSKLFFKDFKLDSTILKLNGESFQINNGALPDMLISAVKRAQNGDLLEIDYLRAKNFRTGMILVKNDKTVYTLK